MAEKQKNVPMTPQERLSLCKKLDQELDEFIDGLEKRSYTEGWLEDRWEEEMEKHPFFMKSVPENGEMSPLVEGLAKLKYDSEENTPLELAANYKEDGNFNFKHKNYRLAILGYTEGLRQKCDSAEMNASLYNNRAAAHWELKNYRSSYLDCEQALSLNPDHSKARHRASKAAFKLEKYYLCLEHGKKALELPNFVMNHEFLEILNKARMLATIKDRDIRQKDSIVAKKEMQRRAVIKAIIERGIKIFNCDDEDDIDMSILEPTLPGTQDAIVQIENDILMWPILLLYPEYNNTDFIKACPENVPLLNQLQQVFPAPWDLDNKYDCEKINVYFEGYDKKLHTVDIRQELGDLLIQEYFELKDGTPVFFILSRDSRAEHQFLETYL